MEGQCRAVWKAVEGSGRRWLSLPILACLVVRYSAPAMAGVHCPPAIPHGSKDGALPACCAAGTVLSPGGATICDSIALSHPGRRSAFRVI